MVFVCLSDHYHNHIVSSLFLSFLTPVPIWHIHFSGFVSIRYWSHHIISVSVCLNGLFGLLHCCTEIASYYLFLSSLTMNLLRLSCCQGYPV